MSRRMVASAVALAAVLAAVVAVIAVSIRGGEAPATPAPGRPASELVLLVIDSLAGPLVAVVGSAGGRPGAVVIPAQLPITIPGQGDGRVADVVTLPGRSGQIAISNMLGLWVDHYASTDLAHLSALVDRAGGIEVGGVAETGAQIVDDLGQAGAVRELAWQTVVAGLLTGGAAWGPADYLDVDAVERVSQILGTPGDPVVRPLPTRVIAGGQDEPDYGQIGAALEAALGAPPRDVVPVIVLNGSGGPGVGEAVAKLVVPDGYRIVISGNASSFDHEQTLIVAGAEQDRQIAEHVRDLLQVGQVVVSGPPSGIARVTIVVGKDFGTG